MSKQGLSATGLDTSRGYLDGGPGTIADRLLPAVASSAVPKDRSLRASLFGWLRGARDPVRFFDCVLCPFGAGLAQSFRSRFAEGHSDGSHALIKA